MTGSDVVKRYFDALAAHDLDGAVACWRPGGVDRMVGEADLTAPEGVREWFAGLFAAFPDWRFEVLDITGDDQRIAVRWRVRATFAGPGTFQGFLANGARVEVEGCDMFTVTDGRIEANHAYVNGGDVARQLGLLPDPESRAGERLTKLANLRTKVRRRVHGVDVERIAAGVWLVRGGFPVRTMNLYLIEDDGGVTVFDAAISGMTDAVRAAAARLGGIKRVVLGHADCDHRGAAPGLGAPVYCHAAEREAAESDSPLRPYWRLDRLAPVVRDVYPRLHAAWDGGAVRVAGTVQEGDEVAGFRVVHFPGHAPGLIGLFREADRLALVSDVIYTLDAQTNRKQPPSVPHPAFNEDTDQARASIRKLAALEPASVWPGHADPVKTEVAFQLERAATAPAP
jgi:steroid delta-isomerase-like uncharacterized protein